MIESQNRRQAPAWTEHEVRDLIAVWGDETVLAELRSKRRNASTYAKVSKGMKDRGYNRDAQQCCVKIKALRQAYQRTRDANGRSGSEPQTCRFYDELHAILGGAASTNPPMFYDSISGSSETTEEHFREDEDDDNDAENSAQTQQGSGEALFPDSQELFVTLEPVPYEPTQGVLPDLEGGEGTSAVNVSTLPLSSPSQRLAKIRSKKKKELRRYVFRAHAVFPH
ncbi:zinc finger and SCAN domain-containing protein 29-like [Macrochelys suwanniensis]